MFFNFLSFRLIHLLIICRLVQNGNLHTASAQLIAQGFKLVQIAGHRPANEQEAANSTVVLVFHKDD